MLCSMEYIQGVMHELRLLLCSSALPPEERLRVLLTAAELVQGEVGLVLAGQAVCCQYRAFSCLCQSTPYFELSANALAGRDALCGALKLLRGNICGPCAQHVGANT